MQWDSSLDRYAVMLNVGINSEDTHTLMNLLRDRFQQRNTVSNDRIFSDLQSLAILPLLAQGNTFTVSYDRVPAGEVNSLLNSMRQTYSNSENSKNIRIELLYVARNMTACFDALDGHYTENKPMSLGLMEDRFNKLRVYPMPEQGLLRIVTNRPPTQALFTKILATLPVLFPTQTTVPNLPPDYFKSLANPEPAAWLAMFATHIKSLNLAANAKRAELTKAFANIATAATKNVESKIAEQQRRINSILGDLATRYEMLRADEQRLFAIQYVDSNDNGSEIVEYILRHPSIKHVSSKTPTLQMQVVAQMAYYSADTAKTVLENPRSPFYTGYSYPLTKYLVPILKKVFITRELIMFSQAQIDLNLDNGTVRADKSRPYGPVGLPNPHLQFFDCWGNNAREVLKAVSNKDYIQAVEQVVAAVGNVNFLDGAVMRKWSRELHSQLTDTLTFQDNKCLQDSDGVMYTLSEYATILKEKEENETNNNNSQASEESSSGIF